MELYNSVADISLKKFASLPKTGKPNPQEWTILSTIVLHDNVTKNLEVLSLGTGSKCIGKTSMSPLGDILNDSHAEVICRRSFLKFLYCEINTFLNLDESLIFSKNIHNKISIKQILSFIFFSINMPCGDASIFPKKPTKNDEFGTILKCPTSSTLEEKDQNSVEGPPGSKRPKLEVEPKVNEADDIYRTGAKCLEGAELQDPKKSGCEFHVLGAVRTKPGRGDPTLSVSCSDKLAKWTVLGIQGSLLFKILQKSIYLSTITIAKNTPFCQEAFKRAISERILNTGTQFEAPFEHTCPDIRQSKYDFEFYKDPAKQPCPASIIWFKNCKKVEVAVEGKKQGVSNKNRNTKKGRLSICKKDLFQDFCASIENDFYYIKFDVSKNYMEWKNDKNSPYIKTWERLKKEVFKIWSYKDPNLLQFDYTD